jgi:hypothetical protein
MKSSPEILQELNSISPMLARVEKINMFSVPDGYFDTLTVDVLKKLNTQSTDNTLAVPEGYFSNLSNQILNKIKIAESDPAQELRTISPMLYSIQNEKVFDVPAGYFANLSSDILEKVAVRPQVKIIDIKRKNSVWRIAAAAVITAVIAVSSLMIFNKAPQTNDSTQVFVSSYIKEASHFKNAQQIDAGIASLSDDEIIKYLEKTGNDADNDVLTKSINPKALPDQTDYLLDDKTLDSYLNNIEKDSNN